MKRSEIQEFQKRFGIWDGEEENAIGFVYKLICLKKDQLEKEEPYATRTIDRLDVAEHEVFDLLDDIDDIEEDLE